MTNTIVNNGETNAVVRAKINQSAAIRRYVGYGAVDRNINTPPGSPAEGDVYIVGTSPTGAWAGQPNKLAVRYNGAWIFEPSFDSTGALVPIGTAHEGLTIYVRSVDLFYVWNGTAWGIAPIDPEQVRDIIGATLVAGSNVTITVNDAADTITIAASGTTDPEVVRDTIGATLVAGNGIGIAVNDPADTITINSYPTTLVPEAYGAQADPFDPTGDNTTLQAARAAANDAAFAAMATAIGNVGSGATSRSNPRTVWFPPGRVYRTTAQVKFENSWLNIVGNGAGIRRQSGTDATLFIGYGDSVNSNHGTTVDGLMIHGGTGTGAHGIQAQGAPKITVRNCMVRNFDDLTSENVSLPACGGEGILIEGCVSSKIENNAVLRPGLTGVNVRALNKTYPVAVGTITSSTSSATLTGTSTTFTTSTFVGARIYNNAKVLIGTVQTINNNTSITLTANAAIAVTANSNWRISSAPAESQMVNIRGNRIYFSGQQGVLCSEGGGITVEDNDIEGCNVGTDIQSCYDFTVTKNYYEINGTDIRTRNLSNLVPARTILGGSITRNYSESAVSFDGQSGDDIVVRDNRFSGSATYGASMNRPVVGRQQEMTGALTVSSTSAIREDQIVYDVRLGATTSVSNSGGNPVNLANGSVAVAATFSTTAGSGTLVGRPLQKLVGGSGTTPSWVAAPFV